MSHFYGGIHGSRGPATRAGTAYSGISGYVQGWHTRIDSSMSNSTDEDSEHNSATIQIGAGPGNHAGGRLHIHIRDVDKFLDAIGTDDSKVKKHLMKLRQQIQLIEQEAEGAIRRQARRDKIAQNKREREYKAEQKRKAELMESITAEERSNFVSLVMGFEPDLDTESINTRIMAPYGNIPTDRDEDGNLIFRSGDGWNYETWNLTTGELVRDEESATV